MSEKKTTKSSTTKTASKQNTSAKSTSTSKSTTKKSKFWGLNKISFYTIGAVAILYLISAILAVCGVSATFVLVLQNIATAILICITAVLAWRYVKPKQTVWKVLYFVLLLVIILGIILPLVMVK